MWCWDQQPLLKLTYVTLLCDIKLVARTHSHLTWCFHWHNRWCSPAETPAAPLQAPEASWWSQICLWHWSGSHSVDNWQVLQRSSASKSHGDDETQPPEALAHRKEQVIRIAHRSMRYYHNQPARKLLERRAAFVPHRSQETHMTQMWKLTNRHICSNQWYQECFIKVSQQTQDIYVLCMTDSESCISD